MTWYAPSRYYTRPQSDEAFDPKADLQWWYFDAILDNGYRLLAFITQTRERNQGDFGINVVVRAPDGKTVKQEKFFPRADIKYDPANFDMTVSKDCSVLFQKGYGANQLGRYLLKIKLDRISLDLALEPELPPFSPLGKNAEMSRPMTMIFRMLARKWPFSNDRFHYVSFVPRGRLSGTISFGKKTINAAGRGYHEYGMSMYEERVNEGWVWVHIDHPDWTITSGSLMLPGTKFSDEHNIVNGYGFAQHKGEVVMSLMDRTTRLVRWPRVHKRDRFSQGEMSVVWEADLRLACPGVSIAADVVSEDMLEYLPVDLKLGSSTEQYWAQTVAKARVEVVRGYGPWKNRTVFDADAVIETMRTAV